ncbi:transporter [Massilia niastensis]|uniref:transporter n=1 Tax=Massilia niastensis TaxID=544911 RepID=UPI00035F3E1E|nr:transporter [Massilia niastensis]
MPPFARGPAILLATCCALVQPSAHSAEPIATDRPDFVESSEVVGKGRWQLETSLAYERDRNPDGRERTVATPSLLRLGIGDTVELRIQTDGRTVMHATPPGGPRSTTTGYADTALGLKWHALDPAGGRPSLGLLLHADLDSGSRGLRGQGVRPSLRVAAEWELAAGMSLGVMPGVGVERDDAGRRYRFGILGVVVGKQFGERLRGFAELALPQLARGRHGGTRASVDVGAAWLLSDDCQLDAMLSRGLNRRTPDLAFTVGLSFRH